MEPLGGRNRASPTHKSTVTVVAYLRGYLPQSQAPSGGADVGAARPHARAAPGPHTPSPECASPTSPSTVTVVALRAITRGDGVWGPGRAVKLQATEKYRPDAVAARPRKKFTIHHL